MIRWSYVIPRFIVGLIIAIFLWFGVDPMIRWMLVSSSQSITGSRVDIADVDASVLAGRIRLGGVEIADPGSPERNLIEAANATLDLDVGALLDRRLVVTQGRVNGVRFDAVRSHSGELDEDADNPVSLRLASMGTKWLAQFALQAGDDVLEQSETVALSKEILARWPNEYERLKQQTAALRERTDALRSRMEGFSEAPPLQAIEAGQQAVAELQAVQQQSRKLLAELRNLPAQAKLDRDALLAAKQRDEQKIRKLGNLARLDGNALTLYLLGPEQAEHLAQIMRWLNWAQDLITNEDVERDPSRIRGMDVVFAGTHRQPNFLIRQLSIDGVGSMDGQPIQIVGSATDLTSEPKVHGWPTTLSIQTHGAVELQLEATVDRTGEERRAHYVVTFPSVPQPKRVLGQVDQLALVVPPGELQISVDVELHGEQIAGRIVVSENAAGIQSQVDAAYGGDRLATFLDRSLAQVNEIEAVIDIQGTVSQPRWKLHSDLGAQLASGLQQALQEELHLRREALIAHLNGRIEQQLERFDQMVASNQEEVLDRLQVSREQITGLQHRAANRLAIPTNLNVRPIRDLFRR